MSTVALPEIADWAVRLSERVGVAASGSLYAVAAESRPAAAAELAARGLRVHVDLIVGAGGHRGVTPDALRAVRAAAPDAVVEVHLIVDGGDLDLAVAEAVEAAVDVRAEFLVLPREAPAVAAAEALRAAGVALWRQVSPDDAADVPDGADGALVMLIAPGTADDADPALVDRVAALSGRMPVGVDGGVTPELAERCVAAGATTIVAGRALFVPAGSGEEQP